MSRSSRRQFIGQCVGAAAGAWLLPGFAQATPSSRRSIQFPTDPRQRVAVSAYPFRDYIQGWKGWDGKTPSPVPLSQQIELKDFAAHVAERFSIYHIEPFSPVFPSTDPNYLQQFRAAVEKAHSSVVNIVLDQEHSQYAVDKAEREKALTGSKLWIDVGTSLASPSIRTNIAPAKDSKPDVGRASDTLARVAEYAAGKNVVVNLENDNPDSEDPFFIAQVIEKVNSPFLRALPDFGNSLAAHDEDFQDRAMEAMFAHATCICHVKDGEVDEHGKASHVDLAKTFAILKKHAYKGYCSIEYEGAGDPYKATAQLIEEAVKYLS